MHTESSRTSREREAVYQGKKRVTGLWVRRTANGAKVYELQHRVNGRMARTKLVATTPQEAIIEARGLGSDIERGVVKIGDRSVTIEALAKSFLEREKGALGTRAPRTVELYEQRISDHVVRLLGPNTKAADIEVAHIRSMVDRLRAMKHNGKKLSGSTIRGTVTAASAMFRHGVRIGSLPRNVVRDLDRGDLPSGKRRTEPRYLGVDSVEKLLGALTDEMRPVAALCYFAALRVSEALAVKWSDVDFDNGTLLVRGTKTEGSHATIPLLPALARELRDLQRCKRDRGIHLVAGDALVLSTKSGKPVARRNVLRAVNNAAVKAGLVAEGQEPIGPHDLRHSAAAGFFALGLKPTEVARLLRHASPRVTLSVYADITEDQAGTLGARLAAGGFGQ
jgi:integrase